MSYYQNQPVYQPNYKMNGYQQYSAFQNPYVQAPSMQQTSFQQDGSIPARLVSGREEAVASNVIPGSMYLFYDRAGGMIYVKYIDPQSGAADFREFAEAPIQPQRAHTQAPQYATVEMLTQMQNEFERRFEALQQPQTKKQQGKVVIEDA